MAHFPKKRTTNVRKHFARDHRLTRPAPDPTAQFYFAYGSNLNIGQMERRCPDATPIGKLLLPDWRLVFRGVADIEPHDGATVDGALWEITGACERELDIYEGVKSGLYRKDYFQIQVKRANGETVVGDALVYLMNHDDYAEPSPYYFDTIERGFDDFGLEIESLYAAHDHAIANDYRQKEQRA